MGVIKRQSLKASIVNYIGVLIGVVFFNFIFPHLLDKEYLGLIGLLQYLSATLISFTSLGLAHILLRFYSNWKNSLTTNHFNAFALMSTAVALIIFAAAYLLMKPLIVGTYENKSALFVHYYLLVIPMVVVQTFSNYFELFALAKLRVAVPAFLREILIRILQITAVFLFAYQSLSEFQFLNAYVAAYLISVSILMVYVIRQLHFKTGRAKTYLGRPEVKSELAYGAAMLALLAFTSISSTLDTILVPAYLGLGMLGIYLRPLVLGQMIQVPYRAISYISIPIIREAFVLNDLQKIKNLNRDIAINLFFIGCFLFTLLISNTDNIFSLFPPEFIVAKNVLYIISIGRLIDMAFGLNSEIINYSKYYRYIIYFSGFMMVTTILLNVILIPRLGMNGAAIASTVSLVTFNLIKTIFIFRKFHFHCFSLKYLHLLAVTLTTLLLAQFIPNLNFIQHHMFINSLLNIACKSAIVSVMFLVPAYALKVSPDFNDFLKLVLTGKIFKGGHKMEHL